MLASIAQAFAHSLKPREGDALPERNGESIVVEGPTGVGKTWPICWPAVDGQTARQKLVISSATIAFARAAGQPRFAFFVLSHSGLGGQLCPWPRGGRYLCPYRLYQHTADASQGELLAPDPNMLLRESQTRKRELEQLKRMADAFYYRRWDGDRDAFDETVEDRVEPGDQRPPRLLEIRLPQPQRMPVFYVARDQLDQVDIVVSNHDLLLADASMGGG